MRPLHWLFVLTLASGLAAAATLGRHATPQATPQAAPQSVAPAAASGVQRTAPGCERCHGELELLRQQTPTLARARAMLVPDSTILSSAHAAMTCGQCHTNYTRFPHDSVRTSTASCASCHEREDTLWTHGAHAQADEPVPCASCHTLHAVIAADSVQPARTAAQLNAPCVDCHEADPVAAHDPHAPDRVLCSGCHASHDTRAAPDSARRLAPAHQLQTCANCHDSTATVWRGDIHADARLQQLHKARDRPQGPVLCTSCHIGHDMLPVADTAFAVRSVELCQECHERAAETFFASYHGKATALGSKVAASCADCHGAHDILPDTFPASHVAAVNLVATCKQCHEHARPKFVEYDSHPNPFDRSRNPWIFYSFWLMNGLLVSVLVVFGAHTLLWWVRLRLDRRRGVGHGGEP